MSALKELSIYNAKTKAPEFISGRLENGWIIANRGRHMKWCAYDEMTGLQLTIAAPTLKAIRALLAELKHQGHKLELAGDTIIWGSAKTYTAESIRAMAPIIQEHKRAWGL